jgi:hypothetical protein
MARHINFGLSIEADAAFEVQKTSIDTGFLKSIPSGECAVRPRARRPCHERQADKDPAQNEMWCAVFAADTINTAKS